MSLSKCIDLIKISLKPWPKLTEIWGYIIWLYVSEKVEALFFSFFPLLFSVQSEEHWLGQGSFEKFFTNQYRVLVGTSIIIKSVPIWWYFTTSLFPQSYMSKCPEDYRVRCQMLNIKNNILLKLVLDHFHGVWFKYFDQRGRKKYMSFGVSKAWI